MIDLIPSPWEKAFDRLLSEAHESLLISSPYIGKEACRKLGTSGDAAWRQTVRVSILTDLSRDTILSGATDVTAISKLCEEFLQLEVIFLPSIHAKVYICDERAAIVTSANMTGGGLVRNYEYGVKLRDTKLVRRIRRDIAAYGRLGTRVGKAKLRFIGEMCKDLRKMRAKAERTVKRRLQMEFDRRLFDFDTELIRVRAAGRAPHAIFADTILYLLKLTDFDSWF